MARLDTYRAHLEQILKSHARFQPARPGDEVERQVIVDRERDHYLLVDIGWKGQTPVDHHIIHAGIKDGRIWIHRDFTEYGVANELLDLGVPKEDIVLAFHAPYKRPYTGFAA